MTNNNSYAARARAIDTIPLGGLLIGLFDLIFAFTFYGLILGVPLLRIFQTVAGGVLGKPRAYAGGVPTFLLGIVLHFVVFWNEVRSHPALGNWCERHSAATPNSHHGTHRTCSPRGTTSRAGGPSICPG